jgi:hypothetical protein
MLKRIALFGESERGKAGVGYFCDSLPQLMDSLGNPPEESEGLHFAIQALMFDFGLIYFPVSEEGFSHEDYEEGLDFLQKKEILLQTKALCLPGVGDREIMDIVTALCHKHSNLLITNEGDLYDYLTA